MPEHIIIFTENENIFKMNMQSGSKCKIKVRGSKHDQRNKVLQIHKINNDQIIVYCKDFSLKIVTLDGENEKWENVGFLCPYCLKIFRFYPGLHKDHIHLHCGPEKCKSCEVGHYLRVLHQTSVVNVHVLDIKKKQSPKLI